MTGYDSYYACTVGTSVVRYHYYYRALYHKRIPLYTCYSSTNLSLDSFYKLGVILAVILCLLLV